MALAVPLTTTAVLTSATQVYTPASGYARDVVVTNNGPATVFIGSSAVTAAAGLPLPIGQTVILQGPVEAVYAIAAATGSSVAVGLATALSVI